jgi:hypothetical protein
MTERDPAKLIWSLANAGPATTLSGPGNSGGWSNAGITPNQLSNLDLRFVDDLALYVYVAGVTSSPTFKVQVNGYDDTGNLFPALGATANITGTGAAAPVYIGRHGGAAGSYVVLPMWGQVAWTCTGGSVTGVEIALWGR